MKYNVGLICSIRSGADKEYIEEYLKALEDNGIVVFYPGRDTNQIDDSGGINICRENRMNFSNCEEIHVIFHPESQGTLFDLGMVFEMNKPLKVVNPLEPTPYKSFKNVLLTLQEEYKFDIKYNIEFNKPIEKR